MTKNRVFLIAIVLLALSVYKFAKPTGETPTELTYSEFLQQVDKQNVKTVRIEGSSVLVSIETTKVSSSPSWPLHPRTIA